MVHSEDGRDELEKSSVWAKFAYTASAEIQAIRQRPMYMKDWIEKLKNEAKNN